MAMFRYRARKLAYARHSTDSFDSGFSEPKRHDTAYPCSSKTIQKLPRSAGLENFIHILERDGFVVVEDFVSLETLSQANDEIEPWIEDSGIGLRTRTAVVSLLLKRSPTIREQFFADSLYQDLCDHFLTQETSSWEGQENSVHVSHPLFSSAVTVDVPPGTPAQPLRRDDKFYHARHVSARSYEDGRDVLLGLYVPGSNQCKANGAPRVAIGSHLWGDEKPDFGLDGEQGILDVEMKKGEALITLGSLYHAHGAYPKPIRAMNESRLMHAMYSCAGTYRQEENPFLSYSKDDVRTFSVLVQERLGWRQLEPALGWVNLQNPEVVLDH